MKEFLKSYKNALFEALQNVEIINTEEDIVVSEAEAFDHLKNEIEMALCLAFPIFTFGNGGSAAVAEHIVSDLVKCVGHDTYLNPFVMNLASNTPLMTCLANDYGYEWVFAKQLDWYRQHGAVVIGISSSGNSPNIIQGFRAAQKHKMKTVALVGFDGGAVLAGRMANYILHVKSHNYGIVEDAHMAILHAIVQKIRLNNAEDPTTVRL